MASVHHRRRTTDEVVEIAGLLDGAQHHGQQPDGDAAGGPVPAIGRPAEHLGDLEIDVAAQLRELVAEQEVGGSAGHHDEPVGPGVAAVCGGPDHAHHGGQPDPAGQQHEAGARAVVAGERAVRPVNPHWAAGGELPHRAGEVTGVPDRELGRLVVCARGDRERVFLGGRPSGRAGSRRTGPARTPRTRRGRRPSAAAPAPGC